MDALLLARHIAGELYREPDEVDVAAIMLRLEPVLNRANDLADAVQAYFNKRGAAHAERHDDIYAMAEALAEWGDIERLHQEAGVKPCNS